MDGFSSLQGPVEEIDGELTLRIPLQAGGDKFVECCLDISQIEGDYLKIIIPEWLASMLRIQKGSLVSVNNQSGKFNIHPINPGSLQ